MQYNRELRQVPPRAPRLLLRQAMHRVGSMKLAWTVAHAPKQFTIDRIHVEKGHVKGNVVISCLELQTARRQDQRAHA